MEYPNKKLKRERISVTGKRTDEGVRHKGEVKGDIQPFKAAEHRYIFRRKQETKKVKNMTEEIREQDINGDDNVYFRDTQI